MKIKNCLFPALAAVVMLASCQKDGAQTTPVETGAKKSVTVTITNIAAPATRTPQGQFTPEQVPVAEVTELNVLFASADGAVVDTRALSDLVPTKTVNGATSTSYSYTFHQVPDTAVKLAVTNLDVEDLDDLQTTLNGYNLYDWQGAYVAGADGAVGTLPSIPVWGLINSFGDPITPDPADPDGYPHFNAGAVEVAPKLARIEIGNIQCLNLGGQDPDDNGFYARFGSLTLANIGIHDTKLGTFNGSVTNYPSTDAGLTLWNTAVAGDNKPLGWNIDPVTGTLTSTAILTGNQFFGFNVVPGTDIPNIILEISGTTENTIGGVDLIPGTVDPDDDYYVKTKSLNETKADGSTGPITEFKAGYIYKVNFKFNTENVQPWDEEPEFICVDVTVVIPDWVIYPNELTPGFADPEE